MSKIPCYQCLCLPVCKFKQYRELIRECTILKGFLYNIVEKKTRSYAIYQYEGKKGYWDLLRQVEDCLNSEEWEMQAVKTNKTKKYVLKSKKRAYRKINGVLLYYESCYVKPPVIGI
ncbi:MAG: hypothetical protein ACTSW1_07655 [Candidatus Hodarchaeales archaeon]